MKSKKIKVSCFILLCLITNLLSIQLAFCKNQNQEFDIEWTLTKSVNHYNNVTSVAWSNGKFFAYVGIDKNTYTIDDYIADNKIDTSNYDDFDYYALYKSFDYFLSDNEHLSYFGFLLVSDDGVNWTRFTNDLIINFDSTNRIVGGNNKLLIYSPDRILYTSTDGYSWGLADTLFNAKIDTIIWDGENFVGCGNKAKITSSDGNIWLAEEIQSDIKFDHIVYGNGIYVGCTNIFDYNTYRMCSKIFTSNDGYSWNCILTYPNSSSHVLFSNGRFFISVYEEIENNGQIDVSFLIVSSTDTENWTNISYKNMDPEDYLWDIVWGKDKFVAAWGSWGVMTHMLCTGLPIQRKELLSNPSFTINTHGWYLWKEGGAKATGVRDEEIYDTEPAGYRIDCDSKGTAAHHIQLFTWGINVEVGKTYKLSFMAKSEGGNANPLIKLMQKEAPWREYAKGKTVTIGSEWAKYEVYFTSNTNDSDARITFYLGDRIVDGVKLYIDSLSMIEVQ